jgi:hypothetical protein
LCLISETARANLMGRRKSELGENAMFICLFAPPRGFAFRADDGIPRAKLVTDQLVCLGRVHSPRIEIHGDNLVVFEVSGLQGRSGGARALGADPSRASRAECRRQLGMRTLWVEQKDI